MLAFLLPFCISLAVTGEITTTWEVSTKNPVFFSLQCSLILNVGQKLGNVGHSLQPVQISANVQNSKNNLFYIVNVYSSFKTACHYYVMTYHHKFFNLIINTICLNILVSSLSSVIHV
jgi:hypothetical protein